MQNDLCQQTAETSLKKNEPSTLTSLHTKSNEFEQIETIFSKARFLYFSDGIWGQSVHNTKWIWNGSVSSKNRKYTIMQTANVNPPITITVRHEELTQSIRDYAAKKIESLHLDYPKIIEAKFILDVQKNRHIAEIVLFCANHITIEAHSEAPSMYAAMDETIDKIARRMRKQKTRLMKRNRPHRNESIRYLDQKYFTEEAMDHPEDSTHDPEPFIMHPDNYKLRTMYKEDAIMELELGDRPFVLYKSARRGCLTIIYRRKDGEYAAMDINKDAL
jgi:putative sigma-54 modulation protein